MTALSSAAAVGLGYIGLPTGVSLATGGLEVTGVDAVRLAKVCQARNVVEEAT